MDGNWYMESAQRYGSADMDAMTDETVADAFGRLLRLLRKKEALHNGIKSWDEITKILEKEGLTQSKTNEILNAADGNRPNPTTYLSQQYIKNHLSYFQNGVTKIKSKAPVDTEGIGLGTFVMPKFVADSVIAKANGNVSKLETSLGLNPGDLGLNPVRIDIQNPKNIRIPSGNEAGAWPGYWVPGGYTKPGGVIEAVIDPVPKSDYIVTENILKIKRRS